MNSKSTIVLGLLILFLAPVRSEDYLKEAQEENSQQASPLVKLSSDRRIKVTLLYIGPATDKQYGSHLVMVYMTEDIRNDEDLANHHATKQPNGQWTDTQYMLLPWPPEVKDGSRRLLVDKQERARVYKGALMPDFTSLYPNMKIPVPDHPDRAGVFEYFFDETSKGPFDIILHDRIAAYGENNFHFHDIDIDSFSSN